jgi:hypothetical protein
MKYITEYRDAARVREVLDEIHRITTHPWRLMMETSPPSPLSTRGEGESYRYTGP